MKKIKIIIGVAIVLIAILAIYLFAVEQTSLTPCTAEHEVVPQLISSTNEYDEYKMTIQPSCSNFRVGGGDHYVFDAKWIARTDRFLAQEGSVYSIFSDEESKVSPSEQLLWNNYKTDWIQVEDISVEVPTTVKSTPVRIDAKVKPVKASVGIYSGEDKLGDYATCYDDEESYNWGELCEKRDYVYFNIDLTGAWACKDEYVNQNTKQVDKEGCSGKLGPFTFKFKVSKEGYEIPEDEPEPECLLDSDCLDEEGEDSDDEDGSLDDTKKEEHSQVEKLADEIIPDKVLDSIGATEKVKENKVFVLISLIAIIIILVVLVIVKSARPAGGQPVIITK